MRKTEIQDLIKQKVAGQGNQLDVGNALPVILNEIIEKVSDTGHSFLSLERLRNYLYRITFDRLPEDNGNNAVSFGGCSAFVSDGRLFRNLDFKYDEAASFIVRTRDYEGMAFITGLNDGELFDELIEQLPYRVVDGRNNAGIMVSTHILYNDWDWYGTGSRTVPITRLPFYALTRIKSMATIEQDMAGILDNLSYVPEMGEYLLQVLVTDGTTTYAILPPTTAGEPFVLQNITANPKLTNFRWVSSPTVTKAELQNRPTGVERFNLMPCALQDLQFTKAYQTPDWLSEFIGINGTTKASPDAELMAIYNKAHALYIDRKRDGQTWQTVHSVVYGTGMESLYIQEDWANDCVKQYDIEAQIGDLSKLDTDHKSNIVEAINEVADALETEELVVSMLQSNADRKKIYDLCAKHLQLAKNIVFYQPLEQMYYRVNGYNMVNGILKLHVVLGSTQTQVQIASNGTISV